MATIRIRTLWYGLPTFLLLGATAGCVPNVIVYNVLPDGGGTSTGGSSGSGGASGAAGTNGTGGALGEGGSHADAATTVFYGHSSEFQCGTIAGNLAANVLYAQPLTIPTATTLTAFGVFGNAPLPGINGIMALYADGNGAPSAPVAFSENTAIVAGNNTLPVTPPMAVPAGAYWIAGQFDVDASICSDNAATNQIDAVSVFPYGLLPSPFRDTDGGAPLQLMHTIDLNFYVVGTW
jgi:hypothetical protein